MPNAFRLRGICSGFRLHEDLLAYNRKKPRKNMPARRYRCETVDYIP